jgi:hypothetical protein
MTIPYTTTRRPSSMGRPRRVIDAMIAEILAWYASPRTVDAKARSLGISRNTPRCILQSRGTRCKQPSPEHRYAVLDASRRRRATLRTGGWL